MTAIIGALFAALSPSPPPPAGIIFTINTPGSYTPPVATNINLVLTGTYNPPNSG